MILSVSLKRPVTSSGSSSVIVSSSDSLPFLDQLQDDHSDEGLQDAARAEPRVGAERQVGRDVRNAGRDGICTLVGVADLEDGAGEHRLVAGDDRVERRLQPPLERLRRLGRSLTREQDQGADDAGDRHGPVHGSRIHATETPTHRIGGLSLRAVSSPLTGMVARSARSASRRRCAGDFVLVVTSRSNPIVRKADADGQHIPRFLDPTGRGMR